MIAPCRPIWGERQAAAAERDMSRKVFSAAVEPAAVAPMPHAQLAYRRLYSGTAQRNAASFRRWSHRPQHRTARSRPLAACGRLACQQRAAAAGRQVSHPSLFTDNLSAVRFTPESGPTADAICPLVSEPELTLRLEYSDSPILQVVLIVNGLPSRR
jgi:hypothetical protein